MAMVGASAMIHGLSICERLGPAGTAEESSMLRFAWPRGIATALVDTRAITGHDNTLQEHVALHMCTLARFPRRPRLARE